MKKRARTEEKEEIMMEAKERAGWKRRKGQDGSEGKGRKEGQDRDEGGHQDGAKEGGS